jgi:hypothetical protein
MTDLIACLSVGKGTWGHVARLIEEQEWSKVYLIANNLAKEKFSIKSNTEFIIVDSEKPLVELSEDIRKALYGRISDMEVAINLISGTGKEHMAILSAVLKLGLGVRMIALTKEGIKEI